MQYDPSIPGVGQVLAGKFKVLGTIGRGGMGVVLSCEHLFLRRRVAVKLLLSTARHADAQRFFHEAQSAAAVRSEHVVRIMDSGVLEDGAPYLVMEELEGCDLHAALQGGGPLEVAAAVDCALEALEALSEVHALGIVHRDIKPSNLFVAKGKGGTPSVKVLDFGIATQPLAQGKDARITVPGMVLGSPHYMPPEAIRGAKLDARADLWSLGVVLFELVAGTPPFAGETPRAITGSILTDPVPDLASRRQNLPPGFAAAVARCLEKNHARRVGSAREMAHLLAPFASERGRLAIDNLERSFGAAAAPTTRKPVPSVAPPAQGKGAATVVLPRLPRPRTPLVAMGVATALAGTVALVAARRPPPPRPVVASAAETADRGTASASPPPPAAPASLVASDLPAPKPTSAPPLAATVPSPPARAVAKVSPSPPRSASSAGNGMKESMGLPIP